ncbi:MAG: thiosulfohydrolase SoxB [Gammaproteobacteria bacterium]
MKRRHFLYCMGLSPAMMSCHPQRYLDFCAGSDFGDVTLMHMTDCHAQLLPVYYREPSTKIGIARTRNMPGYLTGKAFLDFFGIKPQSRNAHALTHLDFVEAARIYGKMGGFAYLAALVKQIRNARGHENTLLLDGGDSWQGSATALWSRGRDMIAASNLLGVDVMTGHWEFTFGMNQVLENLRLFAGEFLAQNIHLTEEAQFAGDFESGTVFKPFVIKPFNKGTVAIIGQAFPYTPIAHPRRFVQDFEWGIQEQNLQTIIHRIKQKRLADVTVLLSHNGLDVDLKLASRVTGLDVILGGHTHDAIPRPIPVTNPAGRTWVTNAGSHGKFLAVIDLDIGRGRLNRLRYRLLPVFSNLIEPDAEMQSLIDAIRAPYLSRLERPLAQADRLLYRRDTYCGTFDQLILDALRTVHDAEISLTPGFRWGTSLLPGDTITYEDVVNLTAITYPETYATALSGARIKSMLEDIADNLFNMDPYYRQGGDMVRTGGIDFRCHPDNEFGRRISQLRLSNGDLVAPGKRYKVSGWASTGEIAQGRPIHEVIVDYLTGPSDR